MVYLIRFLLPDMSVDAIYIFKLSLLTYGSGFILWIIENAFCKHVQNLQLHAIWHLCAGYGTYAFVTFLLLERLTFLKKKSVLGVVGALISRGNNKIPCISSKNS